MKTTKIWKNPKNTFANIVTKMSLLKRRVLKINKYIKKNKLQCWAAQSVKTLV